jgi:K(+)-stimulated pyrophosphate-energized sodium pump
MSSNLIFVIGAGAMAMAFSFWKTNWISNQEEGNDRMKSIGLSISEGAMAFLNAEYRILAVFVTIVALLLGFSNSGAEDSSALISLSFIVGAAASALAGYFGMKVATKSNNRTTHAAQTSLSSALNVAFTGGSVMGLSVVGLGVLGLSSLFILYSSGILFDAVAPTIKDKEIRALESSAPLFEKPKSRATIVTKTARIRYSAFKKAIAPSEILKPIDFIRSLPSS